MLNNKEFLVLDAIDRHRPQSQRVLMELCRMSLGTVNNVLKKLMDRELVRTSNPEKGRGPYFLTRRGAKARERLSESFFKSRLQEFEDLRHRLLENLRSLEDQGIRRLLILSSESLGKLLAHLAQVEKLQIRIVGCPSTLEALALFPQNSYDSIFVTHDQEGLASLLETHRIPADKVTYLK